MSRNTAISTSLLSIFILMLSLSCCKDCPDCPVLPEPEGEHLFYVGGPVIGGDSWIKIFSVKQSKFIDSLTGFERWVYDSFTKHVGYLTFNAADSQSIVTQDARGYFIPELSKNPDRRAVLSPTGGATSLSFEMDYHHPPGVDIDNAILYQKVNDAGDGFTTAVSSSLSSDSTYRLSAIVSSGTYAISASYDFDRGVFNRVGVVYDHTNSEPILRIFSGSSEVATSNRYSFGAIDFVTASFIIRQVRRP